METIAKLSAYSAIALLLLAANIWFARTFFDAFFRDATPNRIPPFQIIGMDDPEGRLAAAMPHMLSARLERISQEIGDAMGALTQEPERGSPVLEDPEVAGLLSIEIDTQDIDVPEFIVLSKGEFGVFDPPTFNMTVGGVEVGGVVSWLHRQVVQHRLLQISVNYSGESGKERPVVYGTVGGQGISLYLDRGEFAASPPTVDELVDMIAYSMMQQQYREHLPVLGAFKTAGFRKLMRTLSAVADLNRRIRHGRTPRPEEYQDLAKQLSELVDTVYTWRPLVHLAAALAENAKDYDSAKRLYTAELKLVGEDEGTLRDALGSKIRQLDRILAAAQAESVVAGTEVLGGSLVERIHDLLGVSSLKMARRPTIGVLGDPPSNNLLPPENINLLEGESNSEPRATEHFDSIVRAVQIVAPDARFVFRKYTDWTVAGLAEATRDIVRRGDPSVLLVTLGPLAGPTFESLFAEVVEKGVPVVISAGNRPGQPPPFSNSLIADQVMVIASVNLEGEPSSFTQQGEDVFWAPGENIPAYKEIGADKLQTQSGTSYSASLTAGLIARVLAEHPNLALADLRRALRDSSRTAAGRGAPKILNLDAALKALTAPTPNPAG